MTAAPAEVSAARRWLADPLLLLTAVALGGGTLVLARLQGGPVPWQAPALLGVVAAGLALSGST